MKEILSYSVVIWFMLMGMALMGGCSTLDDVDVDGILERVIEDNEPVEEVESNAVVVVNDPPPDPQPEPQPEPEPTPIASFPVDVDYSRNWIIEVTGKFKRASNRRYFSTGNPDAARGGLDIFNWSGRFAFRLYNRKIIFPGTSGFPTDHVSSPPPTDHWAMAKAVRRSGVNTLRMSYDLNNHLFTVHWNGEMIGHFPFEVRSNPPRRTTLWIWGVEDARVTQIM